MINLCISSYKRYETVGKHTVALFKDLWYNIFIFVRAEEELLYKQYVPEATIVPVEKNGITPTRNAIVNYFKDWEKILMLDDDIKSINWFIEDWNKYSLIPLSKDEIKEMIEYWFYYTEKIWLKCRWIYPVNNAFFMSEKTNSKCFIIWTFCWIINDKSIQFDERMKLKEDYDYSLQQIAKYGWVVRFNRYSVKALHYSNKGWAVDCRNDKNEQEAISILKQKRGKIIRDNPKRPNEILFNFK